MQNTHETVMALEATSGIVRAGKLTLKAKAGVYIHWSHDRSC